MREINKMNTRMLSLSLVLCAGCASGGEEFVELEPTVWSFTVETIRNNCPEEVMEEVGALPERISIRAGHTLPYYELLDLTLTALPEGIPTRSDPYNSNYLIHTHLFLGQDLQGFLIKTADCGKYICQLEGQVRLLE